MARAFRVEALDAQGNWKVIAREENNYQRLMRVETDVWTKAVRFIPEETWGMEHVHVLAWDVDG